MQIKVKGKLPKNPTSTDVVDVILKNRNINTSSDYFTPRHPTSLTLADFGFDKEYIDKAINLIWSFYGQEKPIIVYSDYDADGITGGAVLWETLHALGFKAFPYIGNRIEEGYGFSKTGLDKVKRKYNPALIISVDHGIAAKEMVRYSKYELGIPIIVTDHHHRQEDKVPTDAEAIFHIPMLSGSGAAYYVAKEIAQKNSSQLSEVSSPRFRLGEAGSQSKKQKETDDCRPFTDDLLANLFASDYIGLASIGTIADLVPLVGPSRAIAKFGLESLTKTKRAGIEAIKTVSGNLGKTITTYEVGFMIAPRINASGRLADALTALRLLCTRDMSKANAIAQELQALNVERQDMVKKAVEEAISIVEKMKDKDGNLPKILIVYQQLEQRAKPREQSQNMELQTKDYGLMTEDSPASPAWHEGIIGLIASKLVEKYYRPAIVLTKSEQRAKPIEQSQEKCPNGNIEIPTTYNLQPNTYYFKASARSIYGFHLTDFLKNFSEYLSHFGGHAAAAGLSVSEENLPIFIEKATTMAETLISNEMLTPTMEVDCNLPLEAANFELAQKIELLEPFGVGNEKPKFVSSGDVSDVQVFGKDNNHLRFNLNSEKCTLPFIAFNKADMAKSLMGNKKIVYFFDVNRWNGSEKLQAKLITVV